MVNKLNKYQTIFSFEKLEVWQKSVDFADMVIDVTEIFNTDRKHYRLIEQLESSSTSISMNIAEGQGRYSRKEFIHFLHIARGSLFETISLLKICHKKGWLEDEKLKSIKVSAREVGKMLNGLINSHRKFNN